MVDTTAGTFRPGVNRRLAFVRWVRRMHGWFGLWGALLGLMTGLSGVWLNHRATLKLELPSQQHMNAQLALPDPAPPTADAMAAWLQGALKLDRGPNNVRIEKARPVPWADKGAERGASRNGERPLMQPERWMFNFGGPNRLVQVEYWAGNIVPRVMEFALQVEPPPYDPVAFTLGFETRYAQLVSLGDHESLIGGLRRRRILLDSPRVLARDDRERG